MINISKIKLIVKTSIENGIVNKWVERETDMETDLCPRQCFKCTDGIWSGHVIEGSGNTYCSPCFEEQFSEATRNRMFENDEQYYTEWDENDFDLQKYEVVHQRVKPQRNPKYN